MKKITSFFAKRCLNNASLEDNSKETPSQRVLLGEQVTDAYENSKALDSRAKTIS